MVYCSLSLGLEWVGIKYGTGDGVMRVGFVTVPDAALRAPLRIETELTTFSNIPVPPVISPFYLAHHSCTAMHVNVLDGTNFSDLTFPEQIHLLSYIFICHLLHIPMHN